MSCVTWAVLAAIWVCTPVGSNNPGRFAEVVTMAELRCQWAQEYGTFPKGGHHGAFDTMVHRYSRNHGWVSPLVDVSFTTDLMASCILSICAEDLSTGLTLGRFYTELSPPATVATRHNQTRAFGIPV